MGYVRVKGIIGHPQKIKSEEVETLAGSGAFLNHHTTKFGRQAKYKADRGN